MNYNFVEYSLYTALVLKVHKNTQKITLMYVRSLSHT